MKAVSLSLNFCLRLARAQAALLRRFDGPLGALHGLGFSDFLVLFHLSRAPGGKLRRIDLAGQVGVTASAVTRTLIPLEKVGLVTRQTDAHDARVSYAVLTRAGWRLLEDSLESAETISRDAISPEGVRRLGALSELLAQLEVR
jgi:DNA-binding MarR family transcriptional regulator